MNKLTKAHKESKAFIIDPAYSTRELPSDSVIPWLYGEAELECWRLQILRRRSEAAELKVGYPGTFHIPFSHVFLRLTLKNLTSKDREFCLHSNGRMTVSMGDQIIYRADQAESCHKITLPSHAPSSGITGSFLMVELECSHGEPPCFHIDEGAFSTEKALWQWSSNRIDWAKPRIFYSSALAEYPHKKELSEKTLFPVRREGNLFDFGKETLGKIRVSCPVKPKLFAGESLNEVKNENKDDFEQSTELTLIGPGEWESIHLLAIRYIRVSADSPVEKISCLAQFHPVQYKGAFASSDETLTKIWMNSTYTLRLCMHDFLIDGIKRDRLPWTGDMAVSLMANAYTFADAEIVRRSLTVLGRAGINKTHINGIIDYSLWWIISQDLYQLYFADREHLEREWQRITAALNALIKDCDHDGFLQSRDTWLFIDWVDVEKDTALQILWWWALGSGAALAERMGDGEKSDLWRARQKKLKEMLTARAWDPEAGLWRSRPSSMKKDFSRHANLLAIVSGLTKPNRENRIKSALLGTELTAVGTPYMKGFEGLALTRLGGAAPVLEMIRTYWGGMMEKGATTFWEAYEPQEKGDELYAFYQRPFARSLCHAWGAGPSSLLPEAVLGIRPLTDGWGKWTISPHRGDLEWVSATVPTPHGELQVHLNGDSLSVLIPGGTTLIAGNASYRGPENKKLKINGEDIYE